MSASENKVFMAYAIDKNNKQHTSAHHSFASAERMLNTIAFQNDYNEQVIKSMSIVRCVPEKIFVPQVIKTLTFAAPDNDEKKI